MNAVYKDQPETRSGGAPALFILSFRHRDRLIRAAEKGGWLAIAARRAARAEARFVASGASVAVVDARGAPAEAQDAVRLLADPAETNAAALLVLLSREDEAQVRAFYEQGATHFLVEPFDDDALLSAIKFADRHAERVGGGHRAARRRDEERQGGGPSWRWQPGSTTVELSPALARKAGFGAADGRQVPLMELLRRLDADGRRAARIAIDRLLETGVSTAFAHRDFEGEARLAHHMRVEPEAGAIVGRTETISLADEQEGQSRDMLTGARDARAARAWIERVLAEKADHHPAVIVLLLAVSRFDAINAAFGRATGDAVLQAAARRIERLVGTDHGPRMVARMAGAQFAVLLSAPASVADSRGLGGRLVEALARPFLTGDHVITLGCRVGVAASRRGDDPASLLRRASAALARARGTETSPVRVLDSGVPGEEAIDEQLDVDLRRALDAGQIQILFQPQVSIATGAIAGVEALARWHHPSLGSLGASTLFAVAERSDYIAQLSDHVQRKAIAEAARWPGLLSRLRLSVNITAADIVRPHFASQFTRLVDELGFPRERVTVEVTESGLIEDLNIAARLLAELREAGLRIAIDDFGTGYSSLAYLKALPLDYLKIDKKLCEDITGSPRDRIVVRSVIDMARSLGLEVIAEGVETREQLELLAQEGCNLYQGFLCSPPVDGAALQAMFPGP